MKKLTKEQGEDMKKFVIEKATESFNDGWMKGQISLLEEIRDNAISGIDRGFTSVYYTAQIKICNNGIKSRQKELDDVSKQEGVSQ